MKISTDTLRSALRKPETRFVILGELCFFAFLIVAIAIRPEGLHENGGISYYSNYDSTWPFYTLGFVLCGLFFLKAGTVLRSFNHQTAILATVLKIMAALSIGLIIFPSNHSNLTGAFHTTFGSSLFSLQFLTSIWLCYLGRGWVDYLLTFLLLAAGLVCLVALFDVILVELEGQVVFQLIFCLVFVRGVIGLLGENNQKI